MDYPQSQHSWRPIEIFFTKGSVLKTTDHWSIGDIKTNQLSSYFTWNDRVPKHLRQRGSGLRTLALPWVMWVSIHDSSYHVLRSADFHVAIMRPRPLKVNDHTRYLVKIRIPRRISGNRNARYVRYAGAVRYLYLVFLLNFSSVPIITCICDLEGLGCHNVWTPVRSEALAIRPTQGGIAPEFIAVRYGETAYFVLPPI